MRSCLGAAGGGNLGGHGPIDGGAHEEWQRPCAETRRRGVRHGRVGHRGRPGARGRGEEGERAGHTAGVVGSAPLGLKAAGAAVAGQAGGVAEVPHNYLNTSTFRALIAHTYATE